MKRLRKLNTTGFTLLEMTVSKFHALNLQVISILSG